MGAPEPTARKWDLALAAVVLAAVVARAVHLEIDAPWGIISMSGEFYTDEGWYTKAAQLRSRFGVWTSEHDTVWFSHSSLFVAIQTLALDLFGNGIRVVRSVSVVSFCVTLAALYAIVRSFGSRTVALGVCAAVSVTLQTFAYSRMALVEPTGTALSMVALAAWTRLPRGPVACTTALVLAAATFFVKVSFVFTLVAVSVLVLGEAVVLARRRRFAPAAYLVLAVAAVAWGTARVQDAVSALEPVHAAVFAKWHVQSRLDEISPASIAASQAKMAFKLLAQTGGFVLVAAALVGAWAWLRRGGLRTLAAAPPGVLAIALWFAAGVGMFGLFDYQPPRYLYFTMFPLAAAGVAWAASAVPEAARAATVAFVVGLHAAVQVPGYAEWLSRDDIRSADRSARDAVGRMDLSGGGPEGVPVIGGTTSFLALYDDRIRPLDFRQDWIAERVSRWRPRYLFTSNSRASYIVEHCPGVVTAVERMASYRIMGNYGPNEDHSLYRIVYEE